MAATGMSGPQADAASVDDAEAVVALAKRERWVDRYLMTTLIATLVRLLAQDTPGRRSMLAALERLAGADPLGEPAGASARAALVARQMASGGRWGVLP